MTTGNCSVNRHWKDDGTAKTLALHSAIDIAYWAVSLPKQQEMAVSIDTAEMLALQKHWHCILL
jgi:hypothetical protein